MFLELLSFIIGKITFFAGSIVGGSSYPKPLPPDEEAECIRKMKQGDLAAKEKLITHNMRLVAHIINKGYPSRKVFLGSRKTLDSIRKTNGHLVSKMESLKT